jgi:hypothetical protein
MKIKKHHKKCNWYKKGNSCICKKYIKKNKRKSRKRYSARQTTPEKQKRRIYDRRRREFPHIKILNSFRSRLRRALKGNTKITSSINLLGCTVEVLKEYLEIQFKPGMNWDNYGKWHIDHVIPCSFFDLRNIEEQKICFHYSNLQPLWAKENLQKKDKLIYID